MAELDGQGIVQPKLGAQPSDRLLVGALADHRHDRIARRDIEQQKRDDEHTDERRDGEEEPAKNEGAHGVRGSGTTTEA